MFRGWFSERLCRDPPMTSPAGNLRYIRTDFTSLDLCRAAGPATYLVYAARAAGFNLFEDTEDQFLRHLDAYRERKVLP